MVNLFKTEDIISILDKLEEKYGYNFPIKQRINGHLENLNIWFISNNIKDMPNGKGVYSAGYVYDVKHIHTLGQMANTLKYAVENNFMLNKNGIIVQDTDSCVIVHHNVTLHKDCKNA